MTKWTSEKLEEYGVFVRRVSDPEEGYCAQVLQFPHVRGWGETAPEAMEDAWLNLNGTFAGMHSAGREIPAPQDSPWLKKKDAVRSQARSAQKACTILMRGILKTEEKGMVMVDERRMNQLGKLLEELVDTVGEL